MLVGASVRYHLAVDWVGRREGEHGHAGAAATGMSGAAACPPLHLPPTGDGER